MKAPRDFEADRDKDAINIEKRGLSLYRAVDFDFGTAVTAEDDRRDYGEKREIAIGFIDKRLHVLVFTMRGGVCRVISLRKANKREIEAYVEKTAEL